MKPAKVTRGQKLRRWIVCVVLLVMIMALQRTTMGPVVGRKSYYLAAVDRDGEPIAILLEGMRTNNRTVVFETLPACNDLVHIAGRMAGHAEVDFDFRRSLKAEQSNLLFSFSTAEDVVVTHENGIAMVTYGDNQLSIMPECEVPVGGDVP